MGIPKLPKTFGEVAEEYLAWLKKNRTEKFWARQDSILSEDVIPQLKDVPIAPDTCMQLLQDFINSAKQLPTEDHKKGGRAISAASDVIGWYQKR